MKKSISFLVILSLGVFTIGCGPEKPPTVKKDDAAKKKADTEADAAATKKK